MIELDEVYTEDGFCRVHSGSCARNSSATRMNLGRVTFESCRESAHKSVSFSAVHFDNFLTIMLTIEDSKSDTVAKDDINTIADICAVIVKDKTNPQADEAASKELPGWRCDTCGEWNYQLGPCCFCGGS